MKLYHVVAMAEGRVIGKDNKLPWHFKSDLKYFKELTLGSTLLMGRKTFESIGRPLPGRENFVLSRRMLLPHSTPGVERPPQGWSGGGVRFFNSVDDALAQVRTPQAYIIGGAELYRETIRRVQGIYLTEIHAKYEGDTFYPEFPQGVREVSRKQLQVEPVVEAVFLER